MRLATLRTPGGTTAARLDGDDYVLLDAADVTDLLTQPFWRDAAAADGRRAPAADAQIAQLVRPAKTVCVGLNYRSHIEEMGRPLPEHPTLFAKFAEVLTGAYDDIVVPEAVAGQLDWEAELGVVVGRAVRGASPDEAREAIAGYTVVNDVSARDLQWRTTQWFAGKNLEAATPVGPVLVTPDDVDDAADLAIRCEVDGTVMQDARTCDLLFRPADVVAYVSQFLTLLPGDLVATGTPGGVAAARDDKPFLRDGQVVTVTVEGIGSCRNVVWVGRS